jgi:sugar lactone lactonase YvrE
VAQSYAGRPDGAAVDAEGFYYAAMYEGHRLAKMAPDGRCVAFIETPVQCPTMPCFGGEDLRTLFITTSAHGRSAAELQALPQSGCVFAMRVDTPGLLVSFFNN